MITTGIFRAASAEYRQRVIFKTLFHFSHNPATSIDATHN
ncbi:hypothetical protein B194_1931 [Serratia plymuthica A30]|nr:hypothetical protein B194_1931 [Serratia plymuthica A30]